ncbi:MAG TPA: hypothetical protein VFK21_07780 [Gammaproteobacteria bacterium]|nr:hypothetical protein [Gammaproteobacteria bacterium]
MKTKTRVILVSLAVVLVLGAAITWYAASEPQPQPALTGATPVGSMTVGKDGLPTLDAKLATIGIAHFRLLGGPGEMDISASDDDQVHVSLELRQQQHSLLWLFHWLSNDTARDMMSATLQQARDGDILTVVLTYPSGEFRSDIQERWKVRVPARLALDADLYAGELKITGMQNGVKSRLTAGETVLEDDGGSVEASVRYGRLHVISTSNSPGVLNVTADHGLAVMSLDGKYYGPREEQGFWSHVHLIGNSVVQREKGKDNMDLSVSYGEADLRIGPLGDFKDYHDAFTAD